MPKGDNLLSATDLALWSLVNEVLIRWKVLVIFKWQMLSVPEGKAGYVHFMVPSETEHKDAIVGFLKKEVQQFAQEPLIFPLADDLHTSPGQTVRVDVGVDEFSGLRPYTEGNHLETETLDKLRQFRDLLRTKS